METLFILVSIIIFFISVLLTYQSYKYFKTIWKFKNRKKDSSENKDFKYFD